MEKRTEKKSPVYRIDWASIYLPRDAFWATVREIAASIPAVLSEGRKDNRKDQLVKTDFLTKDVTCKHTEENPIIRLRIQRK